MDKLESQSEDQKKTLETIIGKMIDFTTDNANGHIKLILAGKAPSSLFLYDTFCTKLSSLD